MRILNSALAFLASIVVTYVAASFFYTQQVLAKQAEIGAIYTANQQIQTYWENFVGLWAYAVIIVVTLAVAFLVASVVKRFLPFLAVIAFPVAGAVGMLAMLTLVEAQLGGGAGIIGGARDALGLTLQSLAGLVGGGVFELMRRRSAG